MRHRCVLPDLCVSVHKSINFPICKLTVSIQHQQQSKPESESPVRVIKTDISVKKTNKLLSKQYKMCNFAAH